MKSILTTAKLSRNNAAHKCFRGTGIDDKICPQIIPVQEPKYGYDECKQGAYVDFPYVKPEKPIIDDTGKCQFNPPSINKYVHFADSHQDDECTQIIKKEAEIESSNEVLDKYRLLTPENYACLPVNEKPIVPDKKVCEDLEGLKTSDIYSTENLPLRFEYPDCVTGYGNKEKHLLYQTTNSEYGKYKPNVHTMPTVYKRQDHGFSKRYGRYGPPKDHSFNI